MREKLNKLFYCSDFAGFRDFKKWVMNIIVDQISLENLWIYPDSISDLDYNLPENIAIISEAAVT